MNTIKIIKSCAALFCAALTTVSCSDYLDVNDNPNDPSQSTPQKTLTVGQRDLVALNARDMTYLGNFISYNWATPSNWSSNQAFSRYTVNSTFYSTIFETSYSLIFKNLTYVENYQLANSAVDYTAFKTIAKILKGFQYQYLVDLYGDVPYTEANLRNANLTPKYDDAQTIYKAVILELTNAASSAATIAGTAAKPGNQDIIFQGNMTKWAQFANTIKLRMLIRLSNTNQDTYIKDQIALITANGAGFITTDVAANPGYTQNADKQSPFYDYFIKTNGREQDRADYTVGTDYTIEYLKSTFDPRLNRLYKGARTGGAFKGTAQKTILPGTGFTSANLSKVGPGLLVSATQSQVLMGMPEALLLQAEAISRGYILGGDAAARAKYEAAITASFVKLAVPDATNAAATYYARPLPNVSWTASTDKIEAIITQKWVALNGTSSIELWIEKTRTGFPSTLPQPAEGGGVRPVRLLYPSSEISTNSKNVPAQTAASAFTDKPFWK